MKLTRTRGRERGSVPRRLAASLVALTLLSRMAWMPCGARADEERAEAASPGREWRPLFDGQSLEGWKSTAFGGEGDVYVEGNELRLDFGSSMTGITYIGDALPQGNYELRLEARRLDGTDFFCGLTFPVHDQHLTLIVGGWGGSLVGLSNLDGQDASQNETRRIMPFRKEAWYGIRLQVDDTHVRVWIDDQKLIDRSIVGRELSLRPEVELCKPLGICTWETRAAVRRIEVR
jgi:hypothetical protein